MPISILQCITVSEIGDLGEVIYHVDRISPIMDGSFTV